MVKAGCGRPGCCASASNTCAMSAPWALSVSTLSPRRKRPPARRNNGVDYLLGRGIRIRFTWVPAVVSNDLDAACRQIHRISPSNSLVGPHDDAHIAIKFILHVDA